MEIKTQSEWWNLLNENWDNILLTGLEIMKTTSMCDSYKNSDLNHILKRLIIAKQKQDYTIICEFIFKIWCYMDGSCPIFHYLAWNELKKLLSDTWIFYTSQEFAKEESNWLKSIQLSEK